MTSAAILMVDDEKTILFGPLFTSKAAGEGSGLGRSICRDIVARHGGRTEVERAPGRTRFAVRLPRLAESPSPPAAGT